jgi:uncharacterized membrane protein (DUF4010 family)
MDHQDTVLGLAVALGAGLLIGIERERRKGTGANRRPAGLRTFAVVAVMGGIAQGLPVAGLVALGALLVVVLSGVAYWKSRSHDPGLTTELALFATYLIGVQAMIWPALAAGCAAGLAGLLAAREGLHRFATQALSEQELHDGLLLAALGLIVLPLIPAGPIALLGGMAARPLAALVLMIMALQAAGHVALRWLGERDGVLVTGFISGFVSSTATVASLGSRVQAQPQQVAVLAGGASLSAAATWVQALLMSLVLAPAAAAALWPLALAGLLGAAGMGWMWSHRGVRAHQLHRRQHRVDVSAAAANGPALPRMDVPPPGSALRPREAVMVGLLLGGVALLVGNAQRHFGQAGLLAGVGLAALVDSHAPIASLASLVAAGQLDSTRWLHGVLLAVGSNSVMRTVVAAVAGGRGYALRVAATLLASLGLAVGAMLLARLLAGA